MEPDASSTRTTRAPVPAMPYLRRVRATCSARRERRLRMSSGSCSSSFMCPSRHGYGCFDSSLLLFGLHGDTDVNTRCVRPDHVRLEHVQKEDYSPRQELLNTFKRR